MKNTRSSLALSAFAAALCWGPARALAACDGSVPGVLTCTGTFDPAPNPVMGSFIALGLHTLDVSGLTADIVKSSAGNIIRASGLNADFTATIDLSGRTLESTATTGPTTSHLIYLANATPNSISATISNGQLVAEGGAPAVTGIIAWSVPDAGTGGDISVWQQSDLDIVARPSVGGTPISALNSAQGIFALSRLDGSVSVRSDGNISADTFGIWAVIQGDEGALYAPGSPEPGVGGDITIISSGEVRSRLGGLVAAAEVMSDIFVQQSGTVVSESRSGVQLGTIRGDITVEIAGSVTSASQATSAATGDANWIAALRLGATRDDASGTQRLFGGGQINTITITDTGSLQSAGGIGEYAIIAMDGNETVMNSGSITGNVHLAMVCPRLDPNCTPLPGRPSGTNAFHNLENGGFAMGPIVHIGSGMAFNNAGTLQPGGTGNIATVSVTGDFVQTAAGQLEIDLDAGAASADRIDVTGSAALSGTMLVNLMSTAAANGQVTVMTATDGISNAGLVVPTDTLTTRYALLQPDANTLLLAYDIDLDGSGALAGLNANQIATAQHLDAVLQAGGTGPLFGSLGGLTDAQQYAAALDQLGTEHFASLQATTLLSSQDFARRSFACPARAGGRAISRGGECLWADISRASVDRETTFQASGFEETASRVSAGGRVTVADGVSLSMAGRYEDLSQHNGFSARSEGDRGHIGLGLSTDFNGILFSSAVLSSYGRFDTTRRFQFGGFTGEATSSPEFGTLGAVASVSYPMLFGAWHIAPRFDAIVTHLDMQALNESGGNGAALTVNRASDTTVSLVPALEVGSTWAMGSDAVARPFVRVGLTWNTNDEFVAGARLRDAGSLDNFANVTTIDPVMADVAAGLDLVGDTGLNVRLSYEGSFGETVASQAFGTRIEMPF